MKFSEGARVTVRDDVEFHGGKTGVVIQVGEGEWPCWVKFDDANTALWFEHDELRYSNPGPVLKPQRKSWDDYYLEMAELVSTRATCDRMHCGAVIVKDGRIVATGYNGSVSGQPHCDDVGHFMENNHCIRTIHAEANALLFCDRRDASGATVYINHPPCHRCRTILRQAGIVRFVYLDQGTKEVEYYGVN